MTKLWFLSPKTTLALTVFFCMLLLLVPANVFAEGEATPGSDSSSEDASTHLSSSDSDSASVSSDTSPVISADNCSSDSGMDSGITEAPNADSNEIPISGDSKTDIPSQDETDSSGALKADSSAIAEDGSDHAPAAAELGEEERPEDSAGFAAEPVVEPEAQLEAVISEGNSYTATISPDAVVGPGEETAFEVTFTEVGDQTIGSAELTLPVEFTRGTESELVVTSSLDTEGIQKWQANWLENAGQYSVVLKAQDDSSLLYSGDWVSVLFNAITPNAPTGGSETYAFETKAWVDTAGTIKNNPAPTAKT